MVPENLLEKNLAELRTMAQALGVKNVGKYRKNELMDILSRNEAPAPKKRGRPTKATSAQKAESVPAAPAEEKPAPVEEAPAQPADKPALKGKSERKRKQPEKPAAPAAPISHPESATIKFTDLKFGKNYDPTST